MNESYYKDEHNFYWQHVWQKLRILPYVLKLHH